MIKKKSIRQLIEESRKPTQQELDEIVNRPYCQMCARYGGLMITSAKFSCSRRRYIRRPLIICRSCAKAVMPSIVEFVASKPDNI